MISDLPFHHKDPFDRLIICKSIVEEAPILGCDDLFDQYEGVKRFGDYPKGLIEMSDDFDEPLEDDRSAFPSAL